MAYTKSAFYKLNILMIMIDLVFIYCEKKSKTVFTIKVIFFHSFLFVFTNIDEDHFGHLDDTQKYPSRWKE